MRERLVTPLQAEQPEIGQHSQRDRAAHTAGLLGHVPLSQMETALPRFDRPLSSPPPRVYPEHRPGTRDGEIGHEHFHALRPIVPPFLGQDQRASAQIMEWGAAGKDPRVTAAPVRLVAGAAVSTALGEVLYPGTAIWAGRQLPCARQSKDVWIVFCRHQTPRGVGRHASIGDPDQLADPGGGAQSPCASAGTRGAEAL